MSILTVYDSEGNEYSPIAETAGRSERIKDLNLASVRFAIEPQERRVIGYFRAKATQTARSEQYYAEFTARNGNDSIGEFTDALRTRLDEWGYILDESADEMAVFQRLEDPGRASTPGAKNDLTILQDLATNRQLTNVGVGGPDAAVGLLSELADSHSVAITSAEATSLSTFDVAVTVGRYSGIEPLGETERRWEQAKQSLRDQLISEEIDSIKQSVQTLKRDHGLSADEIKRKVPSLSSTGSTGPSSRGAPASKGERIKRTLLSPKVGKYMFIGAVVLLVLLGGFYGATTFGLLGSGGDGATIGGTVYADGEPAEGVTVELTGDQLESPDETTTSGRLFGVIGSPGKYEFTGVPPNGTYDVTATVDGDEYEETGVEPGEQQVSLGTPSESDESGGMFSFLPFVGGSDSGTNETETGGDTASGNETGGEEGSEAESDSQAPSGDNSTDESGSEFTAQTFSLRGTVTDASGLEEDGVNIRIENESLLADEDDGRIRVTSGERGEYQTEPVLQNGTYKLEASVPVSESNSDQDYSGTVEIAGNTTEDIQLG
ncbi:carboxypeptidase-like regulatory domain-containing protein [Halohasta salina]|uniref:carboxypeptidase-like regulatory domain-containing protein n=1 Tax=Halohasta salina TaxID=2961621 RepID=UPI0020A378D8|nr:carboxypeptidase-like regulatory domain-containing protein [Halohasta salina]